MSTRRSEQSRKPVIRLVDEQSSRITQKEEVEKDIPKVLKADKTLYEAELKKYMSETNVAMKNVYFSSLKVHSIFRSYI